MTTIKRSSRYNNLIFSDNNLLIYDDYIINYTNDDDKKELKVK